MDKVIQWYPGHMARAIRIIKEKLRMVDVVIEILDARAPKSSVNKGLRQMIGEKPLLRIMNKVDLSDPNENKKWLIELNKEEMTIPLDSIGGLKNLGIVTDALDKLLKDKEIAAKAKGKTIYPIKAMVVGIPNSGKSTFMNNLAKRKVMATGDRPGVTKNQEYLKASDKLILLDNPGVLWPKFEDQEQGMILALLGAIKEDIVPISYVAEYGIKRIKEDYPELLKERYDLEALGTDSEVIEAIGRKRGCLMRGGEVDALKTYDVFLRDLRSGRLGRITLEKSS